MVDPLPERLGQALADRYTLRQVIGEGGMATVYLADDLRHGRRVAVKVLRPELAAVIGAARFEAEIKTTASLQHPHILPLFDSGEAGGFLFYVMPFVEGESLRSRLDRDRQLPVSESVSIAAKVAAALQAAHEHGIVHRDIKPENILLAKGEPLVADFGIARAVGGGSRLTETGLSLGTPRYMSPEQAMGDASTGPATDIWSLGCVLYEMLVGEPPHRGSTPQAILGSIVTGRVDPVTTHRANAPPNVEAAVAKALERIPSDRFATAADFARALGDPSFRHGASPARRRWGPVAAAVGAAYALGVATWLLLGPTSSAPQPSPVRFVIPDIASGSVGRTLAISPDGSVVAYGATGNTLSLRRLADFGNATTLGTDGALQPFFSPDGQWVGYFQGIAQSLQKIPTSGGATVLVAAGTGERALGGSWGGDGTIVFALTSGLYRVSEDGGTPMLLREPDRGRGEQLFSWPHVLPGGRAVLYTAVSERTESDGDASIECLDLESRQVSTVLTGGAGARLAPTGHLLFSAGDGTLHAIAFDAASCTTRGERVALDVRGIALSRGWGADFDVSPGGTLVYLLADQEPGSLVWLDRSGAEEPVPGARRGYNYARVSPDGGRIAVDVGSPGSRDIYVVDAASGSSLRLTNEPGEEFLAEWSPHGDSVYFSSNQRGGTFDLFRRAADGTGEAEHVLHTGSALMLNQVARDGSLVAAEGRVGRSLFDVTIVRPSAPGQADTLLSTSSAEYNSMVSPDGTLIAYQSDATGQYEVYVSPMDGASRARWKVSIDGGEKPIWSPTGDTIFFRSRGDSMMAAAVERTPAGEVRVRNLAALFSMRLGGFGVVSGRSWDLSPRDGRFVISRRPPRRASGIRVVLGWTQELERAMRN